MFLTLSAVRLSEQNQGVKTILLIVGNEFVTKNPWPKNRGSTIRS